VDNIHSLIIKSEITDHFMVTAEYEFINCNKLDNNPNTSNTKLRCKLNKEKVTENILQTPWDSVFTDVDAHGCADVFIGKVKSAICNASTPMSLRSKFNKLKPWISNGLVKSIRRRDQISKLVKRQPFNPDLLRHFKMYRNILSNLLKTAKDQYFKKKINSSGNNPKQLWQTIGELAGRKKNFNEFPIDHFDVNVAGVKNGNKELFVANALNNFFVGVGESLASKVPVVDSVVDDESHKAQSVFSLVPVTEEQLASCVRELRGGSAPGEDGIAANIIKDNFELIKYPLLHVVNTSISQGVFPDCFKIANVIPLYKGGSKGEFSNYRPISLLSVVSKVLEKCVRKQLEKYLIINTLICQNQFGFRSELNSDDALFNITNSIHNLIDKN
jgi:hypothetical protein